MIPQRFIEPPVISPLGFMVRSTPQLRALVCQQQATLTPADFAEMIASIRAVFAKYSAKLLEFAAGAERAIALHRMMDQTLKPASSLPISCRKGCSGCCHYEVEVTSDEAFLLRDIVLHGLPIDHERLALQAARMRHSPDWRKLGQPANRCIFLGEDGGCRIYEDRPSICRKHTVTTPADACTTEGATVIPVQVLLAEILLSAHLSADAAEIGPLPQMLQRLLIPAPVPT